MPGERGITFDKQFEKGGKIVDPQHSHGPDFVGETVLVTGASRGLGREIARRLAEMGASVGVNYVSHSAGAESLVNEIRASGGQALAVQADVGEPSQVRLMVERVSAELGPVSLLVNNAGVLFRGTLETIDPEDMQRMWRIDVDGVVHVTRAVVPGMKARRYGRIVNVSSIAAHGTAMPSTTFYAAAKAAVSTLTRRFAMELGREGITVNAVAPGFILTDMVRQGLSEQEYQGVVQKFREVAMVGRVGEPADVANAVAFLLARDSGFITGQILTVDGGRTDYIGHP